MSDAVVVVWTCELCGGETTTEINPEGWADVMVTRKLPDRAVKVIIGPKCWKTIAKRTRHG